MIAVTRDLMLGVLVQVHRSLRECGCVRHPNLIIRLYETTVASQP